MHRARLALGLGVDDLLVVYSYLQGLILTQPKDASVMREQFIEQWVEAEGRISALSPDGPWTQLKPDGAAMHVDAENSLCYFEGYSPREESRSLECILARV